VLFRSRSAIAALIAFVDVPVVHFSVDWWRTLHQKGTVFNRELSPTIEGNLAWALLSGVFAFTFLYLYLLERRYRLAVLEDRIDERILEAAIAERRAEADNEPVSGGMGGVPPTTAAGAARGVGS
jgi:heme exporter protein C